ncbi:MAG: YicC family protein [Curvibacter sp.]|nr:YicC family protein [Curvibacter sp.]
MPVYSMTGYATAQQDVLAQAPGGEPKSAGHTHFGLEIRSVNSRFLDLSFRLPEELRQHEPALRELLTSKLKRGKVEVRAALDQEAAGALREPSSRQLQKLNAIQDTIRAWLPQAAPLSVADVIRLGSNESNTLLPSAEQVLALAGKAVKELQAARQREGARLSTMLQDRIGQLRTLAAQAVPLVPQLVEQQRQRFLERWKEAMKLGEGAAAPEAAQDRALSEATAFAIRIDVAEEISRLESHLDELSRLLEKGGELGKRLDFLIQELHREANTLGSKSSALELTRISVDMKVAIEQMREQVQNIE